MGMADCRRSRRRNSAQRQDHICESSEESACASGVGWSLDRVLREHSHGLEPANDRSKGGFELLLWLLHRIALSVLVPRRVLPVRIHDARSRSRRRFARACGSREISEGSLIGFAGRNRFRAIELGQRHIHHDRLRGNVDLVLPWLESDDAQRDLMVSSTNMQGVRRVSCQAPIYGDLRVRRRRGDLYFGRWTAGRAQARDIERLAAADVGDQIRSLRNAGILPAARDDGLLRVMQRPRLRGTDRDALAIDQSDGFQVDVDPSTTRAAHARAEIRNLGIRRIALGDYENVIDAHILDNFQFQIRAHAHAPRSRRVAHPQLHHRPIRKYNVRGNSIRGSLWRLRLYSDSASDQNSEQNQGFGHMHFSAQPKRSAMALHRYCFNKTRKLPVTGVTIQTWKGEQRKGLSEGD